ncbi:hypothetical protein [Vibrio mexicanus]|uniref:hypothetical protein n=1 Tax=Vibrio mexicanus TaxID=1004326 RepID=UPI00063C9A7D|nr:hypothetical protein [Vibrio mexicanus]
MAKVRRLIWVPYGYRLKESYKKQLAQAIAHQQQSVEAMKASNEAKCEPKSQASALNRSQNMAAKHHRDESRQSTSAPSSSIDKRETEQQQNLVKAEGEPHRYSNEMPSSVSEVLTFGAEFNPYQSILMT